MLLTDIIIPNLISYPKDSEGKKTYSAFFQRANGWCKLVNAFMCIAHPRVVCPKLRLFPI